MQTLPLNIRLEPYFKIAEKTAKLSPCSRRQYGSVIAYAGIGVEHVSACNARVSRCCDGKCARDTFNTQHGQRTEVGAEIHSETAALIESRFSAQSSHFILVGYEHDRELLGTSVYPCYGCAKALKYAGYTYIYIRNISGDITPISVSEILQYREREWETDV